MKVIHGSLKGLLQEVKDRKVESVRVAAFMQSDIVTNGIPRYTAWVVVTAVLDWDLWAEWRLLRHLPSRGRRPDRDGGRPPGGRPRRPAAGARRSADRAMSPVLAEPGREAWWVETGPVASLDFGLAITPADFDAAFRLLHDQYVWRRYMVPIAARRRINAHNLLPTTKVLVARSGDGVVATLTVVEDSRLGLPVDEVLGTDLGRLRSAGRRVAEAGSLGVDVRWRPSGVPILVRLYRLAALYAAVVARLDWLAFVVHPRHLAFYRTLLPFRQFAGTRRYRRLEGAPMIGLCLDLALVRALVRTERAGLSVGPHTRFLCGLEVYDTVVERLRRELPRSTLTPVEWARLFAAADPPLEVAAAVAAVRREPGEDR
jgi:hypothetical protein